MKTYTKFIYTVNGQIKSEKFRTTDVFSYNAIVKRLLSIADKYSIRATSV